MDNFVQGTRRVMILFHFRDPAYFLGKYEMSAKSTSYSRQDVQSRKIRRSRQPLYAMRYTHPHPAFENPFKILAGELSRVKPVLDHLRST